MTLTLPLKELPVRVKTSSPLAPVVMAEGWRSGAPLPQRSRSVHVALSKDSCIFKVRSDPQKECSKKREFLSDVVATPVIRKLKQEDGEF